MSGYRSMIGVCSVEYGVAGGDHGCNSIAICSKFIQDEERSGLRKNRPAVSNRVDKIDRFSD